jgi:hypothetical protein
MIEVQSTGSEQSDSDLKLEGWLGQNLGGRLCVLVKDVIPVKLPILRDNKSLAIIFQLHSLLGTPSSSSLKVIGRIAECWLHPLHLIVWNTTVIKHQLFSIRISGQLLMIF